MRHFVTGWHAIAHHWLPVLLMWTVLAPGGAHAAAVKHAMPAAKPAANANRQVGLGSWYGAELHGRRTASGEVFDMDQLTAAHPRWPLSTWVRVVHRRTGKSVVVRINDRGPFGRGRIIDLSHAAALRLGVTGHGAFPVIIERLAGKPDDVESSAENRAPVAAPAEFASAPPAHGIE